MSFDAIEQLKADAPRASGEFPAIDRLLSTPNYPQLEPEPPAPEVVPPPPIDKAADDALREFQQNMAELDATIQPKPEKAPSWIGQKLRDFQGWRQSQPRRRYVTIRTAGDLQHLLHDTRLDAASTPPFSPSYLLQNTSQLTHLVSHFAGTNELVRAGLQGLDAQGLASVGLQIFNLRTYHRTPADLVEFFTNVEGLCAAGFTKVHFDSRFWSLAGISAAFKQEPIFMGKFFGMTPRDLLFAGVEPRQLREHGVTADALFMDRAPFELFYALGMEPAELKEHFGMQPHHLCPDEGPPLLSQVQLCLLTWKHNWTQPRLLQFGCTQGQLRKLGMLPTVKVNINNFRK
jgi:hypothetical protein